MNLLCGDSAENSQRSLPIQLWNRFPKPIERQALDVTRYARGGILPSVGRCIVLLLEPEYDSIRANLLAKAARPRILPDLQKRVDADSIRGYCGCSFCNWNKGPNIAAIDPFTETLVPLFNPRTSVWQDHFALTNLRIEGRTASGRATVQLLRFNSVDRIKVRDELAARGELDAALFG